jgi:hypothetical protein
MRILLATILFGLTGFCLLEPAHARVKPAYKPSSTRMCMPTELKRTLNEIEDRFGAVQVVSGHRPGAKIAGSGRRSKHADCQAVDFNPPRGKYQEVAAWLKANHSGGVGTYGCGMGHIHIDVGGNARWHKCGHGSKSAKRGKSSSKKHASASKSRSKHASASKSRSKYASRSRSSSKYTTSASARTKYTRSGSSRMRQASTRSAHRG